MRKPNKKERQFLEAYDKYAEALFRFVYFHTSSRESAKDLTQEVFMRVWRYLGEGNAVENMRALLYRTARNAIIDERRKKKEDSLDALQEAGFEPENTAVISPLVHAEFERAVRTIRKLDDNYREPLLLRYVEGMEIGEIAEALALSENAVSIRLHRGVDQVRKILQVGPTQTATSTFFSRTPREAISKHIPSPRSSGRKNADLNRLPKS